MIKVAIPIIGQEEIDAAVEVLKSGMYTSGKIVNKFEEEFAEYIGTKYAVACNSGTAALHMVLKCLGIDEDSRVIVPDMSFFASASSVFMAGGGVEFADVKYDDCNINPKSIEKLIDLDTRAIMPVHFYGNPCDMDEIMKIADDNNLFVIEDCAQAHGAEYKGKKVGSFGIANCFSFFATKNMTTIEGGMITTDEKYIYNKCKQLRSHGMTDRNTHSMIGYNYRMTELNGAIGRVQLRKLDEMNDKRINNSHYLHDGIKTDRVHSLVREEDYPHKKHVYFWFPVEVNPIWIPKFMEHLQENGIGYRHRYLKPLHTQPLFKGQYDYDNSGAELMSGRVFGLPNHPGLGYKDLDKVIEVVNNFKPTFGEKHGVS